jgi:hypothetical protein
MTNEIEQVEGTNGYGLSTLIIRSEQSPCSLEIIGNVTKTVSDTWPLKFLWLPSAF